MTPASTGLTAFDFHIDEKPVAVAGPVGPHLFRSSADFSDVKSSLEVDLLLQNPPSSATTPLYHSVSKLRPDRRDTPVPNNLVKQEPQPQQRANIPHKAVSEVEEAEIANWTPDDVVRWMQSEGFDDSVVEKFFINDISGSILLELQAEDLKELDIQSFGKRHRLMNSIRQLRNSFAASTSDFQPEIQQVRRPSMEPRESSSTPQTIASDPGTDCSGSSATDEESQDTKEPKQRHRRRRRRRNTDDIVPADSVSIVAIEQILPKIHKCSKGEECRKWQKQQAKIARLTRDIPIESLRGLPTIVIGDPGNPTTAPALMKSPTSAMTPSVVASSDVFGHNQAPGLRLSEDKLNEVQPRDAQENVRNFLNFQRLSRLRPANDSTTPPIEVFPQTDADSTSPTKMNDTLTENLRQLPKLTIPSTHASVGSSNLSPNLSGQRTITPSAGQKKPFVQYLTTNVGPEAAYGSILSPSEFYRQDPHYEQSTPFSEVDVPVTAIPVGPIERACSQSVPPDMRFGSHVRNNNMADPILRPASTKPENHYRKVTFQTAPGFRALGRLDEGRTLRPIETIEDLERTPRAAHCRVNPFNPRGQHANDITHSGWMKKRKTRLLRHDWEDHHFTLKGTQLAMFPDEEASHRDSKALEYIDVDDYAVACSSFASNSKLTAAFKKTVLKRKESAQGGAAFAFSLIPATTPGGTVPERKSLFTNSGKSHHFAVKTREERIDWMRELMLAKALKRGRESGAAVQLNGNAL